MLGLLLWRDVERTMTLAAPSNGFELSGAGRLTDRSNDNARKPPDGVRFSEGLGDAFT